MNIADEFWKDCDQLSFFNEADVETKLIVPMLTALGYDRSSDIVSKMPIDFKIYEGKSGRKPEADFIVFSSSPHSRANSLVTVEAKHPNEKLEKGKMQAESYAQNLKTPFIFLCNGPSAQLWQLQTSTECNLLFEVSDGEYAANRHQFESYLSKEAAISLTEHLVFKNFNLSLRDYSTYEILELERFRNDQPRITRQIYDFGNDAAPPMSVCDFVGAKEHAVIVAKSGFGKSVLAKQICIEALEQRFEEKEASLPVEVSLPELAVSGQSLQQFVVDRISVHHPSVTLSSFARLVREEGVLVVADGLNRVPHQKQLEIITQFNILARDFPRLRVVVLTNHFPDAKLVGAMVFELREFHRNDLETLAALHDMSSVIWLDAPQTINEMAKVPVLAARIVEGYKITGQHFHRIDQIFEHWLENGLADVGQFERALLYEILEKLASTTRESSISVSRFSQLMREVDADTALREKIMGTGLVVIEGEAIELVHETLATYLRAKALMARPAHEIGIYLAKYGANENHLFGSILMALAPDRSIQDLVWCGLLKHSLEQAIGGLRYRNNLAIQFKTQNKNDKSFNYLSDVHQAIVEFSQRYLRSHVEKLYEELSGVSTNDLGIAGNVTEHSTNYTFFDAAKQNEKVIVEAPDCLRGNIAYGDNLHIQGFRLDSGRIIGLKRLQNAMHKLCDKRKIQGGRIWLEERCLSRFRYLTEAYGWLTLTGRVDIAAAIKLLTPEDGTWANDGHEKEPVVFSISDLIYDLNELAKLGVTTLRPWWISLSEIDLNSDAGRQKYATMVDVYYSRSQAIYFEYVSQFPKLKPHMRGIHNRPHRYAIMVYDFKDPWRISWKRSHMPVMHLSEAGADIFFEGDSCFEDPKDDPEEYARVYKQRLVDVGRFSDDWSWSYSEGGAPDFSGNNTSFGKIHYETSAMSLAIKWLKEDIDHLFSELPSTDTGRRA